MEKDTTTDSEDGRSRFDETRQSNSVNASVPSKDRIISSVGKPIHYRQPEASQPMVHVLHRPYLPINQPPTYNCYPQAARIQPLVPQPMGVVDSRNRPLQAYSQPSTLISARQQSTDVVVQQKLYIQPVVKYSETPGLASHPAHDVRPKFPFHVDDQRPGTSATGQCEPGCATDSIPLVEQGHPEAATEAPTTAVCEKERDVSQAKAGPAESEYENVPPLNASPPTHRARKKFACPYCRKMYVYERLMLAHVKKVHTEERPYKCEYEGCAKDYSKEDSLKQHVIRVHMMGKPYRCPFCKWRKFTCIAHLEDHKRTHFNKHEPVQI